MYMNDNFLKHSQMWSELKGFSMTELESMYAQANRFCLSARDENLLKTAHELESICRLMTTLQRQIEVVSRTLFDETRHKMDLENAHM